MSDAAVKISRKEVEHFKNEMERINGLFSLVQESFEFEYNTYQSVGPNDIQEIRRCVSNSQLRQLFDDNPLVGRGGAKFLNKNVVNGTGHTAAFLAFKKSSDDKTYDIVYCTARQIKMINWEKIGCATAITTSAAAGATLLLSGVGLVAGAAGAALLLPGVGLVTGAAIAVATAVAGGALQTYFTEMPNVTLGYIGKELERRNLLKLVD